MPGSKPRILILSYTPAARSPRVLKQIAQFGGHYHVTTVAYGPAPAGVDEHIELTFPPATTGLARVPGIFSLLLLVRAHRAYAALEPVDAATFARLDGGEWDVVVAHDAQTMAVASRLASRHGVLCDMHEYAPEQSEPSLKWNLLERPYFMWLCKTFVSRARAVTTVSQGIVEAYRKTFGINADLVVNATPYQELAPTPTGSTIRLVHSGLAAPDRRLEVLIEGVLASTADVTLDLYLVDGTAGYADALRELAKGDARIRFQAAVPYAELIGTLARYDVGVSLIAPTSFNYEWSLPNKFFDFIQARLGVIIGPSPAMVDYVERYALGEVADGFEATDFARVLDGLDATTVDRWKAASHAAARELSGEEQAKVWGRIVSEMVAT